ncbi:MAG TPA: hypothetical protein VNA20_11045 [Frankiaceae bacterium]|nr:hypothetical protein [Frankiaceae bacterium]
MTTAPTPDPPAGAPAPPPLAPPVAPPIGWLLAYRVLGLRLPAEHRAWVAQDVARRRFLTWREGRSFVWGLALVGLYYVAQTAIFEPPQRRTLLRFALLVLATALLPSGKTLVRRTLRWQRVDRRGQPVQPKGWAVLDNREAVVVGVAVLVLFTGATSLYAFARRPTGVAAAKCGKPDEASISLIRSGLKDETTALQEPRQLTFGEKKLFTAMVDGPEGPPRLWIWLIEGSEVYGLWTPAVAKDNPTSFATLPRERADPALGAAIQRLVECIGDGGRGGGG